VEEVSTFIFFSWTWEWRFFNSYEGYILCCAFDVRRPFFLQVGRSQYCFRLMPPMLCLHMLCIQAIARGVQGGGGPNRYPIYGRACLSGKDAYMWRPKMKRKVFPCEIEAPHIMAPRWGCWSCLWRLSSFIHERNNQLGGKWGWGWCSYRLMRKLVWADGGRWRRLVCLLNQPSCLAGHLTLALDAKWMTQWLPAAFIFGPGVVRILWCMDHERERVEWRMHSRW
jgi:hypothetical protein